jgi:hypothetical protein
VKDNGVIFGYDPGGNNCHGLAKMSLENGRIKEVTTTSLGTAEDVIQDIFAFKGLVLAIGIDTLTCWSTGRSGWRPADRWLRMKYPEVQRSVISPNNLRGSMSLNGMAVLSFIRNEKPNILITETHPKVLYYSLIRKKYDYDRDRALMDTALSQKVGVSITTKNDNVWDAALSAYAAFEGFSSVWKNDLHELLVEEDERIVRPYGKTRYFWPEY